ncbi:uronyl 2-sulfotransferase-like [Saccoglossus kowalevskii]|uniref:Uronyl 2-sulfotransferase-like n=1 Tax=Saccoglossus kowalevskii TaxID=10224 RepID=A0ABM0GZ73_SACKO|nr:PREDICTED: uronyl 2-sulfotransferase-like [Saccoglossus kowalevskii]
MLRIRGYYVSWRLIITAAVSFMFISYLSSTFDVKIDVKMKPLDPRAAEPDPETTEEKNTHLKQSLVDASDGLPLDLRFTRNITRMVFNRVGKCGSRSLIHTIDLLSKKMSYPHVKSKIFTQKKLLEHEQAEFAFEVDSYDPPFIYNRHVNFVDFARYGVDQPYWINQIRDPLNRTVSFFYYTRFGDGMSVRDTSGRNVDLTFDDCVLKNHPECNITNTFAIIPYFCGQDPGCYEPTRYALETAKQNVLKHFIFVGVLEEFTTSLLILEQILPQFFQGAPEAYQQTQEKGLVESYKSVQRKEPSENVKAIMKERLSLEYEFYYFVKRRFDLIKDQLISDGLIHADDAWQ